jgi:hypothetical protein
MADDSMVVTGGGSTTDDGDFDPSIVLALDPVATGGSITINGPVNTSLFRAATGTSLTASGNAIFDAAVRWAVNAGLAPGGVSTIARPGSVVVSWTPIRGASNYIVQRRLNSTDPWVNVAAGLTLTELKADHR